MLSEEDLERIEDDARHDQIDQPWYIRTDFDDVIALVAEVRRLREREPTVAEKLAGAQPFDPDSFPTMDLSPEEMLAFEDAEPAPLDTGRWRRMDSGKWMLPDGSSPVRPGLVEPDPRPYDYDPADPDDVAACSWRIQGDGATVVTAEDLEAAAAIIRNEEKDA